jgi:hypothetical protein
MPGPGVYGRSYDKYGCMKPVSKEVEAERDRQHEAYMARVSFRKRAEARERFRQASFRGRLKIIMQSEVFLFFVCMLVLLPGLYLAVTHPDLTVRDLFPRP